MLAKHDYARGMINSSWNLGKGIDQWETCQKSLLWLLRFIFVLQPNKPSPLLESCARVVMPLRVNKTTQAQECKCIFGPENGSQWKKNVYLVMGRCHAHCPFKSILDTFNSKPLILRALRRHPKRGNQPYWLAAGYRPVSRRNGWNFAAVRWRVGGGYQVWVVSGFCLQFLFEFLPPEEPAMRTADIRRGFPWRRHGLERR